MDRLLASVKAGAHASYIKLSGTIDEDNQLAAVSLPSAEHRDGPVFVDCGDIERINSRGVRDWIRWLDGLASQGHHLVLIDCAPPIVAQLNLVANFAGTSSRPSRIRSVQLPYFCARCDEEHVVTHEVRNLLAGQADGAPPACRCATCGEAMDFDDIPESYFSFLKTQRVAIDTADATLLSEFSPHPIGLLRPRLATTRQEARTQAQAQTTAARTSVKPGALPSLLALSSVQTSDNIRAPTNPSLVSGGTPIYDSTPVAPSHAAQSGDPRPSAPRPQPRLQLRRPSARGIVIAAVAFALLVGLIAAVWRRIS